MGIQMSCSQLHGLTQHHTEGDFPDIEFVGNLQGLTNIIAIFYKRLLWQVRIERFHKAFALATAIDDHAF